LSQWDETLVLALSIKTPSPNHPCATPMHVQIGMGLQWDETLVLALSGMGRLLRAHLRVLLKVLPRFDEGWEEVMLVVESSMAGGRHETAVAAVSLLTAVLQVSDLLSACQRAKQCTAHDPQPASVLG